MRSGTISTPRTSYDRYFQIVRCFRDEDLRADRQPEFTQIDCEMSFVEQEDVLNMFEGMMRTLFKNVLDVDIPNPLPRMSWYDAMDKYGSDKPDVRFGMTIHEITDKVKGNGFSVLDDAAYVGAIAVPGGAEYTRKQIDEITEWVKRPQVGAKGLIYIKLNADGTVKSSIDKFYTPEQLQAIAEAVEAKTGDIVFVMSGPEKRKAFTDSFLRAYRESRGHLITLDSGITADKLSGSVVDAKILEVDNITKRKVASVYNMPPRMLGDTTASGYSTSEQDIAEFLKLTMIPIVKQWEEALNRRLLTYSEIRQGYTFRFNMDALKRGDTAAMADKHSKAIRAAAMTPNEAREEDGLPRLENGDELLVPRDLIPLRVLIEHPELLLTGRMEGGEE